MDTKWLQAKISSIVTGPGDATTNFNRVTGYLKKLKKKYKYGKTINGMTIPQLKEALAANWS